jgi:hypothetical protein
MPTKQISAVDWLYETLWKQTDFSLPNNILEQAKEIEKQNIINGYHVGYSRAIMPKQYNAQEYYEQNFNKEI